MKKALVAAGAILALAGAPAQAACWTPREVAAAKVRDLDTMLMVSALRCRFENAALIDRYKAVVTRHRAALTQINLELRDHFVAESGQKEGLNRLDSYITRVANRYGAGADGLSCDMLTSIAAAAESEVSTPEALIALAERAGVVPELTDAACPAPVLIAAVH